MQVRPMDRETFEKEWKRIDTSWSDVKVNVVKDNHRGYIIADSYTIFKNEYNEDIAMFIADIRLANVSSIEGIKMMLTYRPVNFSYQPRH
jgi:hypothetical protein